MKSLLTLNVYKPLVLPYEITSLRSCLTAWLSITHVVPCIFTHWCLVYSVAATEMLADGDNSQKRMRSETDDVYQLL